MNLVSCKCIAGLAAVCFATSAASAATYIVDDFNSYTSGTVLSPTSGATPNFPWRQTGNAITSRLTSNTVAAREIDGTQDGLTAFSLTDANNYMTFRRNYGTTSTMSFTGYSTASVAMKSTAATAGTEVIQLSLANAAGTQYFSTQTITLSTTAQTFTFDLSASNFGLSDSAYATLISGVAEIGFRVTRASGVTGVTVADSIAIDNFTLTPEPATATMAMGLGVLGLMRRRK